MHDDHSNTSDPAVGSTRFVSRHPWFGRALAIAQHQDRINSWPAWKRWLHRALISRQCPCCVAWKEQQSDNTKRSDAPSIR